MKKVFLSLAGFLTAAVFLAAQPSGRQLFNGGWTFLPEGGAPRTVDLPHDWGVEQEFDIGLPGASGKLPWWGKAVYKKNLAVSESDLAGDVFLEIDGAMAFATVYCNGQKVGGWPYGYASWRVENALEEFYNRNFVRNGDEKR